LGNINVDIIKKYLNLDLIPVLHGDVLIDNKNKFSVLSGDQMIYFLAKELKADRVIMGTDVDGVFDSNPKTNKKVTLYTVINKNNVKKIKVHETNSIDVTGGMGGKINELLQLAEVKIKSEIINITKEKILEKSLTNQKIVKTVIS
ncbi:MAG: amino acid kinase, partial [Candidatus Pacebacteria bacterium]|nr:amino acid kinase [Candidatus Paceibacterota bacterium]